MVNRLNEKNDKLLQYAKVLNRIALFSCWVAVFLDIAFFMITGRQWTSLLFAMYTPLRYFLFDIAPQKEQKRPASLDRSIPLSIFVRYLSKELPVLNGSLMADLWGLFLAICRATINGYALLWFDTFTFAYAIRDDSDNIPVDKDINLIREDDRLNDIDDRADKLSDEQKAQQMKSLTQAWRQTRQAQELGQWSFPLRRYLKPGDDFMALKEVNAELLDDKNQLDWKAYKAFKEKQRKHKSVSNKKIHAY